MSVIGKMNVQKDQPFETGQKVTLSVVCENAFMAHYHPENENVVFTKYSPSGSAEMHFDKPIVLPKRTVEHDGKTWEVPGELYLIYIRQKERPQVDDALFFSPLRCASRTEYGGDMKTIELCSPYYDRSKLIDKKQPSRINIKLGIDNPGAANQFEPGTEDWWVVAYSANEMDKTEALALAHSS